MSTSARTSVLPLGSLFLALALSIIVLPSVSAAGEEHVAAAEQASPASAAFEKLKSLAGKWDGEDGHRHEIELSAAGTVVMETMGPGTAHEMVNMYFLDEDRLMLTHYCAGGNQPQMQLQPQKSSEVMHFDFVGGTNLDPAVDQHIHAAKIVLKDNDTMESHWTGYENGKAHHEMIFHLSRHGG